VTSGLDQPASMPPRIEVRRLSKTFGHSRVLSEAELTVLPGEIHALVGQNGSGKSTLIKALAGYHAPDRGAEVRVDGRSVRLPIHPGGLRSLGISFVHQDLGLVEHLSVAENISVGREECGRVSRRIDRRREAAAARALLAELHVGIDPTAPVGALSPEQRACVAIARALGSQVTGGGLIILDESTRALSIEALTTFYASLRRAVRGGGSVLVVAHSLQEVMAEADRVTILRDGVVVGAGLPTSELSQERIARLMTGREVVQVRGSTLTGGEPDRIAVRGLRGFPGPAGPARHRSTLDFGLAAGEVLGLTGPAGGGWEDAPSLLSGAAAASSGSLTVDGVALDLTRPAIRKFLDAGVVAVPERRLQQGIAGGFSVTDNISLPRLRTRGRPWFSGARWQRLEAEQVIRLLDVRPADPRLPVGKLSGGNQQKVLFGKWMLGEPALLILHEATQGVDVAARQDLFRAIDRAAKAGTSILMVSNDPSELSAICHRVLVVRDGSIAAELTAPGTDDILNASYDASLKENLQS
jgi:ribose transport system ATP-binding protein